MKCPSFTSAKLEGIRFRLAVPGSQQAPVWAERDSNASLIPPASQGAGGCLSPLHPRRRPLRSFFPHVSNRRWSRKELFNWQDFGLKTAVDSLGSEGSAGTGVGTGGGEILRKKTLARRNSKSGVHNLPNVATL